MRFLNLRLRQLLSKQLLLSLTAVYLLVSLALPAPAQIFCEDALESIAPIGVQSRERRQSLRFFNGDRNSQLTFGLEVEFNVFENPQALNYYRIPDIPEAQWLRMSFSERKQKGLEYNKQHARSFKRVLAFVKLSSASKELPNQVFWEGDGNFEINGRIFNTVQEAQSFINLITELMGPASWQAHVAFLKEPLKGAAGYTVFSGDISVFEKLENGYKRYSIDSHVTPAKAFTHHSLGPLGANDLELFVMFENKLANRQNIGSPYASRVTGASVLRGDTYGPDRVGYEIRPHHKNTKALIDEMDDLAGLLENGQMSSFVPFSNIELISQDLLAKYAIEQKITFNQYKDWADFFTQIHSFIAKKHPNLLFGGATIRDRFLFPFRDWKKYPALENLPLQERVDVQKRIDEATRDYFNAINKIIKTTPHNKDADIYAVDDATIKQILVALSAWGYDVQLAGVLQSFKKQVLESTQPSVGPPHSQSLKIFFENFRKQHLPHARIKDLKANPNYSEFLDNTIEVLHSPDVGPFGHIRLRIGQRIYGFENIRQTIVKDFLPHYVSADTTSAVFWIGKEKLEKLQAEIETIYVNSSKYNIPPFDAYSPLVEVQTLPNGQLSLLSPSPQFGADNYVNGKIVDGQYLQTPDGTLTPLMIKNGKFYIQSYSCSTSASFILNKYFNIKIPFNGASTLGNYIQNGSPDIFMTVSYSSP